MDNQTLIKIVDTILRRTRASIGQLLGTGKASLSSVISTVGDEMGDIASGAESLAKQGAEAVGQSLHEIAGNALTVSETVAGDLQQQVDGMISKVAKLEESLASIEAREKSALEQAKGIAANAEKGVNKALSQATFTRRFRTLFWVHGMRSRKRRKAWGRWPSGRLRI